MGGKSTLLSALSGTLPRRYVVSGHVWSAGSCRRVGVTEGGHGGGDGGMGGWNPSNWRARKYVPLLGGGWVIPPPSSIIGIPLPKM